MLQPELNLNFWPQPKRTCLISDPIFKHPLSALTQVQLLWCSSLVCMDQKNFPCFPLSPGRSYMNQPLPISPVSSHRILLLAPDKLLTQLFLLKLTTLPTLSLYMFYTYTAIPSAMNALPLFLPNSRSPGQILCILQVLTSQTSVICLHRILR